MEVKGDCDGKNVDRTSRRRNAGWNATRRRRNLPRAWWASSGTIR